MNFFEKILHGLSGTMKTPTLYNWFHLMFIGIAILTTILLCVFYRNCSDKTFRRIALISWIIMVVLEVYKQLVFSFEFNGTTAEWDYQWYAFPFQFCSSPLYALPFIIWLKDGKVRDAFIAYMGTYSLFAGIAVFIFPDTVFIETIGINIQTMVHHGLQIVLGVFFMVHNRKKFSIKFFLRGIIVFAGFVVLAMIMNLLAPLITTETFNMFFISPYFECTLPVLSAIYPVVPYFAFLLIYILGFTFIGAVMLAIQWGITYGVTKLNQRKLSKE